MSEKNLTALQKLNWLGLSEAIKSTSSIEDEFNLLKQRVGNFSSFVDDLEQGYDYDDDGIFEAIDSFTAFEQYLYGGANNIGFTQEEGEKFIAKIKANFTDEDSDGTVFDEFKSYIINEVESFEDGKIAFNTEKSLESNAQTASGDAAAGVKFHESRGFTKEGVEVPAGATEIYGTEVHFSKGKPVTGTDPGSIDSGGSGSGGSGSGSLDFQSIQASQTAPFAGKTVQISVDVVNNKSEPVTLDTVLLEDDYIIRSETFQIFAGATQEISFDITKQTPQQHKYKIGETGTIEVTWLPVINDVSI